MRPQAAQWETLQASHVSNAQRTVRGTVTAVDPGRPQKVARGCTCSCPMAGLHPSLRHI